MNAQLLTEMQNAVKDTVSDKKIGVAFSGGVDSTLLAKLVKDLGYDVHLLTIGFMTRMTSILPRKKINCSICHIVFQKLILKNLRRLAIKFAS